MRTLFYPSWTPVVFALFLLLVSQPVIPASAAEPTCGTWNAVVDQRLTAEPASDKSGVGCEMAFRIVDHAGALSVPLPFVAIKISDGYTLELSAPKSDALSLSAFAIPGIDADIHVKPSDVAGRSTVVVTGDVTGKSLSVDVVMLIIDTILDELGLPVRCVPYSYVYGLAVGYTVMATKAAGYLYNRQWVDLRDEVRHIHDDIAAGVLPKLRDSLGSAAGDCLKDAAVRFVVMRTLDAATAGSTQVFKAANAALKVGIVGTSIMLDRGKAAAIRFEYTPSGQAAPIPKPPKAPTDLRITATSGGTINLGWHINSDDEEGFRIYSGSQVVATGVPRFDVGVVNNLTPNATYCFTVVAYNAAGESARSNEVCGTASLPTPTPVPTRVPTATPIPPTPTPTPLPSLRTVDWSYAFAHAPDLTVQSQPALCGYGESPLRLVYKADANVEGFPLTNNIHYGDLDGDGVEEAVIDLLQNCSGGAANSLIYRMTASGPHIVASLVTPRRFGTTIVNNRLEVRTGIFKPGDGQNDPSGGFTVTQYRLQGNQLIESGSRVEPAPTQVPVPTATPQPRLTAPSGPQNVQVKRDPSGTRGPRILVTWTSTDRSTTGFRIYVGYTTTFMRGSLSVTAPAGATSMGIDLGPEIGPQVCVWVVASNQAGESAPSGGACLPRSAFV